MCQKCHFSAINIFRNHLNLRLLLSICQIINPTPVYFVLYATSQSPLPPSLSPPIQTQPHFKEFSRLSGSKSEGDRQKPILYLLWFWGYIHSPKPYYLVIISNNSGSKYSLVIVAQAEKYSILHRAQKYSIKSEERSGATWWWGRLRLHSQSHFWVSIHIK